MHLVWAAVLIIGTSAIMITAMLLVRRRAPRGGYFVNGDRAAAVFGVLATGFALLLGFAVFLAFARYDDARDSAHAEALAVAELYETAQLLPPDVRETLSGELVCYARSVIAIEWPLMSSNIHPPFNEWGNALFLTLQTIEPRTASEQSAFDSWLATTNRREDERRLRLHGGEGLVPLAVWIVLFLCAGLILLFLLFFADSEESAVAQSLIAGTVTALVVALLLLLAALNRPYQQDIGGLDPHAMQHTLQIIDEARATLGIDDAPPCDASGRAL
jgi:hypothetical protein